MMNNVEPLVTVLVCCYNAQAYLDQCLSTLLKQEGGHAFSVILVNDGSTDDCRTIAASYQERLANMTIIDNAVNRGLTDSCNAGLQEIRTPFFLRLDADDYLAPDALAHIHRAISGNTDNDFILFHRYDFDDEKTCAIDVPDDIYAWVAAGTVFKTEVVKKVGGYSKEYWEEYDLYLKLLEDGCSYRILPEKIYFYRRGHASMTQNMHQKVEGFKSLRNKWGAEVLNRYGDLNRILEYYDIRRSLNVKG